MHQNGTLFVHNVCVEHSHRGRGFAAQLFAWLGVVYKGPLSLTVYGPTAALFKSNRMVLNEVSKRFKKLLTMYGRYGFTIVGIQNDMVQMQAGALRSVPPAKGTRLTL
jgi:GNAT superfamily N-acetyltransferase